MNKLLSLLVIGLLFSCNNNARLSDKNTSTVKRNLNLNVSTTTTTEPTPNFVSNDSFAAVKSEVSNYGNNASKGFVATYILNNKENERLSSIENGQLENVWFKFNSNGKPSVSYYKFKNTKGYVFWTPEINEQCSINLGAPCTAGDEINFLNTTFDVDSISDQDFSEANTNVAKMKTRRATIVKRTVGRILSPTRYKKYFAKATQTTSGQAAKELVEVMIAQDLQDLSHDLKLGIDVNDISIEAYNGSFTPVLESGFSDMTLDGSQESDKARFLDFDTWVHYVAQSFADRLK